MESDLIFLHSSFRTSSTWMWDRFRKLTGVTAYYEIFNEALFRIKRDELNQTNSRTWYSKHPSGAAYFLEFMPLIADCGGVEKYDEAMSFINFIPKDGVLGDISNSEKEYISNLILHADMLGTIPVLSSTRSLGRLHAIKAAFPGFHILIYRNLFRQWCSYTEQYMRGNPYFFDTIKRSISNNTHDTFCQYLHETFNLDNMNIDSEDYFCAFVLFHIYLYGQVADVADLIVNVDQAIHDETYRRGVEHEIQANSGLKIDLSDIEGSIAFSFHDSNRSVELRERIRVVSNVAISLAPSSISRDFALKALSEFIEEWEKYDFYAGTLSKAAGPKGLLSERNAFAAERDLAVAECKKLLTERDSIELRYKELLTEHNVIELRYKEIRAERDALEVRYNASTTECDAQAVVHEALIKERDALAERAKILKLPRWRRLLRQIQK